MSRPLDPAEKDASRRESEAGSADISIGLAVAEERRDPRENPEAGDWLSLRKERWLVLGPIDGGKKVMVERMAPARGQHRLSTLTLMKFQQRFVGAEVLGKRTNWKTRSEIARAKRLAAKAECHVEGNAR